MEQHVAEPRARKKKEPAKLEFEAGKVFNPTWAKGEDLELDLESARYRAMKGQGGTRRS